MNNKEIKTRRMLSYFIRSAQDIMKEEGISGITLRKVADGAGYNTATKNLFPIPGSLPSDIFHQTQQCA